eukprot:CAMPEP_0181111752 /NCGR_PEP_ID=MMETSP1071-20121207/19443_1 /TAXON_ID=35127 /ORGANISM="Thalassiosira sp., Strain NH16" /LENGTH=305 /DNA_ID=CAMNT_0023195667 /DNA_START=126 /DNA_END=1043 /DNA_ORIENTATION=+
MRHCIANLILVALALFHSAVVVVALSSPSSPLIDTKWKLRLDVGLQQGSWMPKRFPGWAESGARLPLDVDVEFTSRPSPERESLVGPKDSTCVLRVVRAEGESSSSFVVSENGREEVSFLDGGWCIQRPTGSIKNSEGSLVKPEGLLRFWLDCPSGARKRDAEIFPGTRIFFTTGVWDDMPSLDAMRSEYETVVEDLQTVVDETREIRRGNERRDDDDDGNDNKNILERIGDFLSLVDNSKDFDSLASKKQELERASPPRGSAEADNGVKIAPTGSLVIKGNKIPDWLPGSEYLILGTFSTKALD